MYVSLRARLFGCLRGCLGDCLSEDDEVHKDKPEGSRLQMSAEATRNMLRSRQCSRVEVQNSAKQQKQTTPSDALEVFCLR